GRLRGRVQRLSKERNDRDFRLPAAQAPVLESPRTVRHGARSLGNLRTELALRRARSIGGEGAGIDTNAGDSLRRWRDECLTMTGPGIALSRACSPRWTRRSLSAPT